VAVREVTVRGWQAVGGKQVKLEKQAAARALFMTENPIFSSLILLFLQNNSKIGLKQSFSWIRDLQVCLKDPPQNLASFEVLEDQR
jgi:hypothetical protein